MTDPTMPILYIGMPDAEMHNYLKATCGVMSCNLKAHTLFEAAVSSQPYRVLRPQQEGFICTSMNDCSRRHADTRREL